MNMCKDAFSRYASMANATTIVPHVIAVCSKSSGHAKQAGRYLAGVAAAITGDDQTGKKCWAADNVSQLSHKHSDVKVVQVVLGFSVSIPECS